MPRTVVRRSLVLWGWGHLALGDPRGRRLGPRLILAELVALAALAWAGPPLLDGELGGVVLAGGAAFVAAWAAVALDAYRAAVGRRVAAGLPEGGGGAIELLWLAVPAIAGTLVLWGLGGSAARPDAVLARYVDDWRRGDTGAAATLVDASPSRLGEAWATQAARLRNELVLAAGAAGPGSGIDPDRPFESVRFVARGPDAADRRIVALEIVRRTAVRGSLLGLLPSSSQVLVPVAELGTVELRRVERASGRLGVPSSGAWRIGRIDLLGEQLPG